jgi:hypothetical protein
MWYILQADAEAEILLGVKPGITKAALKAAFEKGTSRELLVRHYPKDGDAIFVPPGTVHALGPGLVLFEVEQNSDLTYRLDDFGRVGLDGKARPLHWEKGLEVIRPDLPAYRDLPRLEFREITDPDGECATLLTVFLPTEQAARSVAKELHTKVVADSGWHVYSNMEHILEKRTVTAEGCPFHCPLYKGPEPKYWKGMLPQTDALLARAINISIGVSDAGLGSGFGVTLRDGPDVVDARAAEFCRVARKHL